MLNTIGNTGLLSDDNRKLAQFSENGITYRAINKNSKRILRYQIDGAMITSESKKCDNALGLPDTKEFYLIELKGSDLKQASIQLYETICVLGQKLNDFIVSARIVCSRIPRPDIRATQIIRLERELLRRHGNLIKQSKFMEEEI